MGCAIYRNDRVVPIEVKEYLCEIQTEHSIWREMPRRMLRHRVLAQCARLAFGVSVPDFANNIKKQKNISRNQETIFKMRAQSHKISLKNLLEKEIVAKTLCNKKCSALAPSCEIER
jgi:hypothetical protein